MWLKCKDVEMAERGGELEFRLYGRQEGALVEVVANFQYLGRSLNHTYSDWPSVQQNVTWAHRV